MPKAPLLSVCIPAYNRPAWLRRGLESIAVGDGTDIEVIITDDSDTDQGQAIAADVLENWSGVWRYEHHQQPLGMAQNWNRAIQWATGQYVMVLHDDDFFLPQGLGRLVNKLQGLGNQYPVLLFGVWVVDAQERVMKRQKFRQDEFLPPHNALIRLFSNSSLVRFPAVVIRRDLFVEVGYFNPDWREPCDLEMWMRLFANYGVYCCREATVAYRVHAQALTMASFHEKTVEILLRLFEELAKFNLLSGSELEQCKQLFFHQYILAGAWRQLRRGQWDTFKAVMGLWQLPELGGMLWTPKWCFFRSLFTALARLPYP
ncbi:glycosyltransferase family 2 protein [Synechocystis salina]|uniref:Glycosyltransferase family 2 protein n=1 Tax=Synechocystis salina LEGE 00031 TaxID=1828736 RepID=A0ABR9VXC0_9SYNC|nr:glycosyltransferase family 2 protein [Synechocystis salina]MBE9242861.1 glycosyltransferase family 2 protein [Synechocystis salina LEGE 00041]MBE9255671.1 glycosyltransferase family 2 protein [Synechocystis salina LEGE 00031]